MHKQWPLDPHCLLFYAGDSGQSASCRRCHVRLPAAFRWSSGGVLAAAFATPLLRTRLSSPVAGEPHRVSDHFKLPFFGPRSWSFISSRLRSSSTSITSLVACRGTAAWCWPCRRRWSLLTAASCRPSPLPLTTRTSYSRPTCYRPMLPRTPPCSRSSWPSWSWATLLFHPHPTAPISLTTDASNGHLDAFIQQQVHGVWQPLSFFSAKLTSPQQRYSTFDRELQAVYLSLLHYRYFSKGVLSPSSQITNLWWKLSPVSLFPSLAANSGSWLSFPNFTSLFTILLEFLMLLPMLFLGFPLHRPPVGCCFTPCYTSLFSSSTGSTAGFLS